MMQGADVVQAIFRSLGIPGWETVGMEPSEVTARLHAEDSTAPESPRSTGTIRNPSRRRVIALAGDRVG
jgi:hypothetical protein